MNLTEIFDEPELSDEEQLERREAVIKILRARRTEVYGELYHVIQRAKAVNAWTKHPPTSGELYRELGPKILGYLLLDFSEISKATKLAKRYLGLKKKIDYLHDVQDKTMRKSKNESN